MGFRQCRGCRAKDLVGLDIGTSSVKVASVTSRGSERRRLKVWGSRDLPSGTIVDGSIQLQENVVRSIEELVTEKKIRGSKTATALPSKSVILKRLRLPRLPEVELNDSLSWEISQLFPAGLEEVNWDYSVLAQGGDEELSELLLAAARKAVINEFCKVISQAGLKPLVVDVDSLALRNIYLHSYGSDGNTVNAILDIGASKTGVTVLRGESLLFHRTLSAGGDQYRQSLQERFGLSVLEAEKYLQLRKTPAEMLIRLQPVFDDVSESLAQEVEKTISYVKSTLHVPRINSLNVCGGGSLIPGLRASLSRALNQPVDILNPFRNLESRHLSWQADRFDCSCARSALAIGLALRMARET